MSPADVILTVVSMTLAVAAFICAWQAVGYARQAREARDRAQAAWDRARVAREEIKRLRRDQ